MENIETKIFPENTEDKYGKNIKIGVIFCAMEKKKQTYLRLKPV